MGNMCLAQYNIYVLQVAAMSFTGGCSMPII